MCFPQLLHKLDFLLVLELFSSKCVKAAGERHNTQGALGAFWLPVLTTKNCFQASMRNRELIVG